MKRLTFLVLAMGLLTAACKKENGNTGTVGEPVVSSISPERGFPLGTLTIKGENFSRIRVDNYVEINGVPARIIHFNEHTIHVEIPEGGSTGAVSVRVGSRTAMGPVFEYRIPPATYRTETYAGIGTAGFAEGSRQTIQMNNPSGLVFDSKGNLLFSDRNNNRIRKIAPDGTVTTVAGSGTQGNQDGTALQARFYWPFGIAVDKDDNIYVADRSNHRIRRIDAVTGMVTTLAGSSRGFAEGKGSAAQFDLPLDVAVGPDGNVYVADSDNSRIRKITPDGTVSTYIGDGTRNILRDGPRETALVNRPPGLTFDKNGNMFIADRFNYCIRKVTPDGVVSTIAGSRERKYGLQDGPEAEALFFGMYGLSVADDGHIYVAEINDNHAIRVITPDGEVRTLGGGGQAGFVNHENSLNSRFNTPVTTAIDKDGNIYVADQVNHAIRRLVKTN